MTKNEIIELARQAGVRDDEHIFEFSQYKYLEAFARLVAEKECYKRLADASEMASNPMGVKSREALRNVREMKTIMTKDEALAQPEQEPVAWMNDSTPSGIFARHMEGAKNFGCTIPLYTAPPQRIWVGKGLKKVTETFYELRHGIDIPVEPTRFPKEYWVHATVYEKVEDE